MKHSGWPRGIARHTPTKRRVLCLSTSRVSGAGQTRASPQHLPFRLSTRPSPCPHLAESLQGPDGAPDSVGGDQHARHADVQLVAFIHTQLCPRLRQHPSPLKRLHNKCRKGEGGRVNESAAINEKTPRAIGRCKIKAQFSESSPVPLHFPCLSLPGSLNPL